MKYLKRNEYYLKFNSLYVKVCLIKRFHSISIKSKKYLILKVETLLKIFYCGSEHNLRSLHTYLNKLYDVYKDVTLTKQSVAVQPPGALTSLPSVPTHSSHEPSLSTYHLRVR